MLLAKTKLSILVVGVWAALAVGCSGGGQMDPAAVKRLAVMPFEDATAQKDFGDLADGATFRLTSALGTAKNLDVIASSSAMEYKLRPRTLADVQKTLGVDALMEGDVNIVGESVTINAWLRDAKTDKRVWETKASGKREATFVVVEQVAESLSQWLKRPLHIKKTEAAPSWQHFLFLLESQKLTKRTDPVDVNLAVYDLEKVRGDYPDFWPARAPQAELFGRLVALEFLTRDKAREWVKGILYDTRQQEPDSAEAYYAEGALKYYVDWDYAAAETALKKAIEIRPNLVYAWHALAQLYITTNRLPLALETIEKAQELDPLGYETTRERASILASNGRWDDSLKAIADAGTLTKEEQAISILRGLFQFGKGDTEAARVSIAALVSGTQELVAVQALYGAVQAKLGKPEETRRMLGLFDSRAKKKLPAADPIHYALLHLSLGDTAKGFSELEAAVAAHRTLALGLPGNPAFTAYRSDPRYQAVIAKVAGAKPIVPAGSTPSANQ